MRSKAVAIAALACGAAVLSVASVAWACTSFSTITLSTAVGTPGTQVSVAGERAAANAPVEVRWNSRTGALLGTATTDAEGKFAVPVRIPEGLPGLQVVLAVDATGDTARAAFEIPGGVTADDARPAPAAPVSSEGGPMSDLALGAGALAAGVFLVGAGAVVVLSGRRRATVTA